MMNGKLQIYSGNGNPLLAELICKYLEMKLGEIKVGQFADGETEVQFGKSVRGKDVFLVQSIVPPANHYLMELLIMIDAAKRASARRVTAVIPYFAYSRKERKAEPRTPITAKLVANLIATARADRVLTIDLHVGSIQGFFDIPVDHLYASPVLAPYIQENFANDLAIVSPDAGGVPRARAYAKMLGARLLIIDKRRDAPGKAKAMNVIGDPNNLDCFILDDLCGSGGTLDQATEALLKAGARSVNAGVTHAVMNSNAHQTINDSKLNKLVVTDTIPLREQSDKIIVLSVADLLGEAISRIHKEKSLSSLFKIRY